MPWLLNVLYLLAIAFAAPWLLYRRWRKGKRLGGLSAKLSGNVLPVNQPVFLSFVHPDGIHSRIRVGATGSI